MILLGVHTLESRRLDSTAYVIYININICYHLLLFIVLVTTAV